MKKSILGLGISVLLLIVMIISFSSTEFTSFQIGNFFSPFTGFLQNAEPYAHSFTDQKKITTPQNIDSVTVYVDDRRVPHIFAKNMEDVYFVEGYLHAQDRLFQMDFMARKAAGRLSEVLGKKYILEDRLQRRLGISHYAQISMQQCMQKEILKKAVQRYAEGVNAYISQLTYATMPIEYKLYDFSPETWTPIKTFLILKLLAQEQSGEDWDWQNSYNQNILSMGTYEMLYPIFYDQYYPVIPVGYDYINPVSIMSMPIKADTEEYFLFHKKHLQPLPIYNPTAFYEKGSTNMAIAGHKTSSHLPLLANFTTGKLELPNRWYEMQITSDIMNLYGITLPGVPVIIEGFGKQFAWSIATTNRDVKDYYRVKINPENKSQYWYKNKWKTAIYDIETIKIKGESSLVDTVYYSIWGPITFDTSLMYNNDINNYAYATHWLIHDTTYSDLIAYYCLNLCNSYQDFEVCASTFTGMNLNITFVDNNGKIGNVQTGNLPAKWYTQGDFILSGDNTTYQYKKIPEEQRINIVNPINNFIVTTNQVPADKRYPYYLGKRFDFYRSALFNETIPTFDKWDFTSIQPVLSNTYNPLAEKIMRTIFFPNIDKKNLLPDIRFVYDSLQNWNYTDENPFAKIVFNEWWQLFYATVIHSLQQELKDTLLVPIEDMALVLLYEKSKINKSIISSCFLTIANAIAQKTHNDKNWYLALSKSTAKHILSDMTSLTSYATYGSRYSILPYENEVGTTWRMIVDLKDKGKGWGILFGGQSGNPGSFYYENNMSDWNNQVYYPLTIYDHQEIKKTTNNRLIFKR